MIPKLGNLYFIFKTEKPRYATFLVYWDLPGQTMWSDLFSYVHVTHGHQWDIERTHVLVALLQRDTLQTCYSTEHST